jgi:hypothetical protein
MPEGKSAMQRRMEAATGELSRSELEGPVGESYLRSRISTPRAFSRASVLGEMALAHRPKVV